MTKVKRKEKTIEEVMAELKASDAGNGMGMVQSMKEDGTIPSGL